MRVVEIKGGTDLNALKWALANQRPDLGFKRNEFAIVQNSKVYLVRGEGASKLESGTVLKSNERTLDCYVNERGRGGSLLGQMSLYLGGLFGGMAGIAYPAKLLLTGAVANGDLFIAGLALIGGAVAAFHAIRSIVPNQPDVSGSIIANAIAPSDLVYEDFKVVPRGEKQPAQVATAA